MGKNRLRDEMYRNERCLCVYVYTGITSRCLSLMQAYYLVRKYHINNLIIIWRLEECCNIRYEEVFDEKQFADINTVVLTHGFFPPKWGKGLKKSLQQLDVRELMRCVREWVRYCVWKLRNRQAQRVMSYFQEQGSYVKYHPPKEIGWSGEAYQDWIERCWKRVSGYLEAETNCLADVYAGMMASQNRTAPVDHGSLLFQRKYHQKAEELIAGGSWVGVHVRRTDHSGCIRESPLYLFKEKMKEIKEQDGNVKFFLATDDPAVEEELCKEFQGCIVTYREKVWGRDSRSGMESAIVDCLCLAACDRILGSYGSVFSLFSAMYGGKELISCKK